jgi:hypothetical protein
MEHLLRQRLIALRPPDHAGLDDRDRMALYYTALLVNVGCHADAHEQAKSFCDDIALKSGKYGRVDYLSGIAGCGGRQSVGTAGQRAPSAPAPAGAKAPRRPGGPSRR